MGKVTDDPLARGREAFGRRAWGDAYRGLAAADERGPLEPGDLDLLATASYLTGNDDACRRAWEGAYRAFAERGAVARAVRCAFWLGLSLMQRGERARGGGWLSRAQGLLESAVLDCVERGYLRVPAALGALEGGDPAAARAVFDEITAIADRFGDPDLRALGRLGHGQALLALGDGARGAGMLDEAMLAVTTGEVSPQAAGIVYCGMITACRGIFDLRRAGEWTAALSRWCDTQQELKPYRGQCLVHRSELMQLHGAWSDAMAEATRACEHLADPPGDPVLGMALYQRAELLRLRGEFDHAEEVYRAADDHGHAVQPGLALLRLAQGRGDDALAAIRRTVAVTEGAVERARLLAAYAEIALAAGDVEAGRTAAAELARIAERFGTPYLRAMAGYAHGSVQLAAGDATAACAALGPALSAWRELDAPYEAAWVRLRIAEACRRLDDHDTAEMELDAARRAFERLGAAPALARVRELTGAAAQAADGLTPREMEVLRLLATGATNREIADTLVISDKTVARHVANMFTKLGLSSRSAATAYAYQHNLV
jgi:ATP/maltotriose-dependent transcriptional regulator MalT